MYIDQPKQYHTSNKKPRLLIHLLRKLSKLFSRKETETSWEEKPPDLKDILKGLAVLGLVIDAIIFSCFSVWFVWRSCGKMMDWFNNWLFN